MGEKTQATATNAETVPVTVIVDNHTHRGKPVEKGDSIEVTPDEREWMLKNKLAK